MWKFPLIKYYSTNTQLQIVEIYTLSHHCQRVELQTKEESVKDDREKQHITSQATTQAKAENSKHSGDQRTEGWQEIPVDNILYLEDLYFKTMENKMVRTAKPERMLNDMAIS